MVELLIGKGIDINKSDNNEVSPLMHASYQGKEKIIRLLLRNGASVEHVSKCKETALIYSLYNSSLTTKNKTKVGRILIRAGSDINAKATFEKDYWHFVQRNSPSFKKREIGSLKNVKNYVPLLELCIYHIEDNNSFFRRKDIESLNKDIREQFDLNLFK